MPLSKLVFKPGINREGTNYSNEGGWHDGDKIRFRYGYVEKMGGWEKANQTQIQGTARQLHDFVTLSSESLMFIGTHKKVYIDNSGELYDITPIRRTVTLGTDPISTSGGTGSGVISITDSGHGASIGDYVTISGSTDVDGITADLINKEHEVASVIDASTYTIDTGGSATTGGVSGGGSSVEAEYQIAIGLDTTVLGPGWGAGTWGRFTWGSAAGSLAGQTLRLWFADNFGEDLIFNIADGSIYYWDASLGTGTRAVLLSSRTGAIDVPVVARKLLVSEVDRHVLAFGANPINETDQDPLLIRFSSQESSVDWKPTSINTAGDIRLSQGSEIVTAIRTSRQILVWTDRSLHSIQFIGPPFTFGTALLGDNVRIAGPNAVVSVNDSVFWMGQENFYRYDGRIQPIPCTVRDYIFSDINRNQSFKIYCGSLASQTEVWWLYPSANSDECNRYVIYNYGENLWYYGTLERTVWNDRSTGQRSYPQAVGSDGYLYDHERGLDADGSALDAYVQSSDFDLDDGDRFTLVRRILPDLSFRSSTAASPEVNFTMVAKNFSGAPVEGEETGTVVRQTISGGQHDYTDQLFMRLRGRTMALKIDSDTTGVKWRLGTPRLDTRPDGRR